MKYSELIADINKIYNLLFDKKIFDAFVELSKLTGMCVNIDFRNRLNANRETYDNVLKYSFEYGEDPEKENVYMRLIKSLLELTDEVREELIRQNNLLFYYQRIRESNLKTKEIESEIFKWIEKISLEGEVSNLIKNEDGQAYDSLSENSDEININNLFNSLWLSDKLSDSQINLLKEVLDKPFFGWYYKSMIVSGLTLSVLRYFDVEKINILFDFYAEQENKVWQRALIGILLVLYIYDSRIFLYPEIEQRIKSYQSDKKWNKTIETIVIQFLRARDTEEINEKIREEIMPELWKMKSKLEEKLNLEDLLSDKLLEDKNPEWETAFEDSPELYNKIEEFSNLQMEGSDVFLSAFAMLKKFDFFEKPGNWFLPFYKENSLLQNAFGDVNKGFDVSQFMEGLEKSAFLCNSDKYSFCLNIKHLPKMQKSAMVELFNMELNAMNEMSSEDEIIHTEMNSRSAIVQYIQDIYRFFRIHPWKSEFADVFELALDFHNSKFFKIMVEDSVIIRNIAEFYFEKNHYQEALDIFLPLLSEEGDNELLEKIAYCYQALGKFEMALEFYEKAELIASPRLWLFNKIAFCYRKLAQSEKAIYYYQESEKIDPDNLFVQSSLGKVYMDIDDFETALKYFFKVEYLAPDNIKVHRPIAWCSFVTSRPENAKKYLEKVIEKEGNQYDYMNLGHVYWSMGDKLTAIQNYRYSLLKSHNDLNWFREVMMEDKKYLIQYGVDEFDIPILIDYLMINPLEKL